MTRSGLSEDDDRLRGIVTGGEGFARSLEDQHRVLYPQAEHS